MADTDLPRGGERAPRPIASRFGSLPGFNVSPMRQGFNVDQTSVDIMSSLAAALTPSKQGVAETLGAPVAGIGWFAHRLGLVNSSCNRDRTFCRFGPSS